MKQRRITALLNIKGNCLCEQTKKIVQNTFDSWKCQLLCNKMSKVEDKLRLKTILKPHYFNVNRTHMNKYACTQILISVHMDRVAYMQNLRLCKLKFALGLNQVQISRICIWCKVCIRVQILSHGQICTREYICIYANICTRMQICPCESTLSDFRNGIAGMPACSCKYKHYHIFKHKSW